MAKEGFTELEPTDDGKYIVTANWIQRVRQAFLDGDIDPLLELVATHGEYGDPETAPHQRTFFHGNVLFSPHLAALLTDVLTGKIKRPKGRRKTIHLSRGAIMAIGRAVDRFREPGCWGMTRAGAIETVADGSPAIEGLDGLEGLEIPKVPKNQIEEAYEEFERLTRDTKSPPGPNALDRSDLLARHATKRTPSK